MRTCPLCGSNSNLQQQWGSRLIRCPECRLVYVDQLPSLDELKHMYAEDFFKGDASYADYVGEKASLQHNFQARIRALKALQPSGKLYEAGCAHGFFLELARKYWDVRGSDISAEAIAYARDVLKLDVVVGDFETNPPEPSAYDVVVMWDTIEHLYDPFLALAKSAAALKPGGILGLTTGDIDRLLPQVQRRSWRLIHPTHLYYFSAQSITRALHAAGLEVISIEYVGNARTLRQMAQILTFGQTRKSWRHDLLRQIERLPFMGLYIPVNLFDIMFVIARKPM